MRRKSISLLALTLASPMLHAAQMPPTQPAEIKPPAATGQPPRVVMVRIGKDEITVQDFMSYLQANSSSIKQALTPTGKVRALRAMVGDRLIRDEILRRGLVPKDQQDDHQAMLKGYRELAAQHFPRPAPPSEEEARAFYEQHRGEYGIPAMRRISQIEFKFPRGADEEHKAPARQKAEAALQRLQRGEAFDKLAAELTENRDARSRNGDLGFLPVPFLKDEVRESTLGQYTGVLEALTAFEILMATDERPELISPFEQVKGRIEQRMVEEGQQRLRDVYVAELARQHPVTVVEDELKPLFPDGFFPSPAPAAESR